MSAYESLEREKVIHAIFMEMSYHHDQADEQRRDAERIYQRVFVPLLMIDEEPELMTLPE